MDNIGQHGNRAPKEITEIISRNIKPGHEKDYDDWLQRYMNLESEVPGYRGMTIRAPGGSSSSVRYVLNRFADKTSLDARKNSDEARKMIEEANNCSTYERATGLETWFSLPDLKTIAAPPRWKMAIVTFIGAYCISSLAQYFIKLYLGQSPLLANVVMNMTLVLGLTYFAMSLLSRSPRRWLYPGNL
jgi:antibiotic biosynthesis monooxygenase (ABM) superfamily enzyme